MEVFFFFALLRRLCFSALHFEFSLVTISELFDLNVFYLKKIDNLNGDLGETGQSKRKTKEPSTLLLK